MKIPAGVYYKKSFSEPFLLKDGNNKGWHFSLSGRGDVPSRSGGWRWTDEDEVYDLTLIMPRNLWVFK